MTFTFPFATLRLNGGPKAAVVVDGRFTELRWYASNNEGQSSWHEKN